MSAIEALGQHAHHWIIEPPNGPTCSAYCRTCGMTRAFRTAGADSEFGYNDQGPLTPAQKRPTDLAKRVGR